MRTYKQNNMLADSEVWRIVACVALLRPHGEHDAAEHAQWEV